MLEIGPRRDVFEALIHFWDHKNNVFCVSDCELTPTLEEIAGFMGRGSSLRGSNLHDKRPIGPKNIEGNKFLDYLLGVYYIYMYKKEKTIKETSINNFPWFEMVELKGSNG